MFSIPRRENGPTLWEIKTRVEAEYPDFPSIDVSASDFSHRAYIDAITKMVHAMGIPRADLTVVWKDLTCTVPVAATPAPLRAISSVVNGVASAIKNGGAKVMHPHRFGQAASVASVASTEKDGVMPESVDVLHKVSGIVEPGTMCLVLGPSGSGSSLMLKRIAGKQLGTVVENEGQVLYNGGERLHGIVKPNHVVKYVGQYDDHIPQITVRDTLEFAASCKWPEWVPHVEAIRRNDVILTAKMLRIEKVLDTIVGSDILRGVSGGEKKRVTIAEMLIGMNSGCVVMDNWSKGLDSTTTLSITKSMREFADTRGPVITSMQAPGTDVFKLFDTVCVLDQGRVIYFGPREKAESWFLDLGFQRPPQRSVPDFLATVANPALRKEYLPKNADLSGLEQPPPLTAEEFAERFARSEIAASLNQKIDIAASQHSGIDPRVPDVYVRVGQKDTLQRPRHQLKAIGRLYLRFYTATRKAFVADVVQNVILSLILGSIFWQLPDNAGGASTRAGIVFLALLFIGLSSLAKIDNKHAQKVVFAKQRGSSFYDAWTYIFTVLLFDIVRELILTAVFIIPLYIMAGLNLGSSAQRLLYAILITLLQSLIMISFTRFLVAAFDDADQARGVGGIFTILFVLFSGYMKQPDRLDDWLKWIYWIDPIHYSFEAMVLNEYDGLKFKCDSDEFLPPIPIPEEFRICPVSTGEEYLRNQLGITNGAIFRLYYFLVLVGFLTVFFLLSAIGTALSKPRGHSFKFKAANGGVVTADQDQDISLDATTIDIATQPFTQKVNTRFTFTNVRYAVNDGKTVLLDGIYGHALSGKVVLLMGESGAGKSTLLDVCAMRKTLKKGTSVDGDIRFNGTPTSKDIIAHLTGYCEQNDLHILEATVLEAVRFSAKLRLPESMPANEKNVRAMETIDLLGLTAYSDVLIKSLGAGELKLLTMAVEVVTDPKVLFLDEPTSGISATSALVVANALRNIANTGTCVICTVHQPSTEVFGMFDRLLLLKRGGKQVYFGDIGRNGSTIREYFESRGASPMNEDQNPADWMLDVIADETKDYAAEWSNSDERADLEAELEKLGQVDSEDDDAAYEEYYKRPGLRVQMSAVVRRLFWRYWRLPEYNFTRVILMFMIALLVGLLFLQDIDNSQTGANLAFAAMFLSVIPSNLSAQNVIPPTVGGRSVFYREIAAGAYSPFAFHYALGVVEIPFTAIASTVFAVVFYFMIGLDAARFGYFFLAAQLLYYFAVALGIVLASITPTEAIAATIVSSLTSVFNVLSGFFVRKDQMVVWWRWSTWINPFYYYLAGVVQNQMEDRDFICTQEEFLEFTLPPGMSCRELGNFTDVVMNGGEPGCRFCPTPNGDVLIQAFGADDVNKWVCIVALLVSIAICRIIAGFGFGKLRFLNR